MSAFLFVHGWGFDASFWNPLRERLAGNDMATFEAGYFGSTPRWPDPLPGYVAIGHSAGFGTLLGALPPGCAGLVSINGFTRFAARPDFAEGVPPRVLARMLSRLDHAPDTVVHRFRDRCGAEPSDMLGPLGAPLKVGLESLRDLDARERLATLRLPVLALAARDDPLVTPDHTGACFPAGSIQWSEHGGHLLPLSRPAWCAEAIIGFSR